MLGVVVMYITSEEGDGLPESEVIGRCKLLSVGAGNQTGLLWKYNP